MIDLVLVQLFSHIHTNTLIALLSVSKDIYNVIKSDDVVGLLALAHPIESGPRTFWNAVFWERTTYSSSKLYREHGDDDYVGGSMTKRVSDRLRTAIATGDQAVIDDMYSKKSMRWIAKDDLQSCVMYAPTIDLFLSTFINFRSPPSISYVSTDIEADLDSLTKYHDLRALILLQRLIVGDYEGAKRVAEISRDALSKSSWGEYSQHLSNEAIDWLVDNIGEDIVKVMQQKCKHMYNCRIITHLSTKYNVEYDWEDLFIEAAISYDVGLLKFIGTKSSREELTEWFLGLTIRGSMKVVLQTLDVDTGTVMDILLICGDTEKIENLVAITS